MKSRFFRTIYAFPLGGIAAGMAVILLARAWIGHRKYRWERTVCLLLFLAAAAGILYATLLQRQAGGTYACYPIPFSVWARSRLRRELYREKLMNVFLFFPLGITVPALVPEKRGKMMRAAAAVLLAGAMSFGIEYLQYRFQLGTAEADDILCNMLGSAVGAAYVWLAEPVSRLAAAGVSLVRRLIGKRSGKDGNA